MRVGNNNNNDNNNNSLINTLIHYIMRNKFYERETTSLRINKQVKDDFFFVCRRMGLLVRGHSNIALEGLMKNFVERYRDAPKIVQTTLTLHEPATPEINLQLVEKLELTDMKKRFSLILERLETKQGHHDFNQDMFRQLLPKAIKIYQQTGDKQMESLLKKAEEFIQ